MQTTTVTGKVIRNGKNWMKRVVDHLAEDATLVGLCRAVVAAPSGRSAEWQVAWMAATDRVNELISLPDNFYVGIAVGSICQRFREGRV